MRIIAVCLLNLHEDERMKPRNWKPVAWLPVYDESRDTRPRTGFDSTSARKIRLYHACWIEFLDRWAERTRDAIEIPWADGHTRWTRLFIGGVMGDQQEGDRYKGEPCVTLCVSSLFCTSQSVPGYCRFRDKDNAKSSREG